MTVPANAAPRPSPPRESADTVVRMRDVTVAYGARVALDDVTSRSRRALLAVIGPNGAGKSTLLKAIAGLVEPVTGSIEVFGAPPGGAARRVAYVPQAELVDWGFPVTSAMS